MAEDDDDVGFRKITKKTKSVDRGDHYENGADDDEPNFSDPEDFEDDVTDEGMSDILRINLACAKLLFL